MTPHAPFAAYGNAQDSRSLPTLPYDVLLRIFELAALEGGRRVGGELVQWRTTDGEDICALALVCRAWRLPAQKILFQSVAIEGSSMALCFLRTARSRPDLVAGTRALSIDLPAEQYFADDAGSDGEGDDHWERASSSMDLVRVVQECPTLLHLHLEPLHNSVRPTLLSAITSRPLESLVASPRVFREWTTALYSLGDLHTLVLPSLRNLELDYWMKD